MAALKPTPHLPTRLEQLVDLRDRVNAEIAAEERRLARIAQLRDNVTSSRAAAAADIPAAEVRTWARDNGIRVGDHGRIGLSLRLMCLDAREEATP